MKTLENDQNVAIPAVDLGGTKIAMAFVRVKVQANGQTGQKRAIARSYPPVPVFRTRGMTDAVRTLRRIAGLVRKRVRDMEKDGWTVIRRMGMGAPGLYLPDGSVDPKSVPNIPGLALLKPAAFLEHALGKGWKVFIENDGTVQALAAAHDLVHSPDYVKKWKSIIDQSGGKIIHFGPGTGFGAGKVFVDSERRVSPMPGSPAFFDMVVRDGRTAEELIGGAGIGRMAREDEQQRMSAGKPCLVNFIQDKTPRKTRSAAAADNVLDRITAKVLAEALESPDPNAGKIAETIFSRAGKDLAALIAGLHRGRGEKTLFPWNKTDWDLVKGTQIFLVSGLLTKPAGERSILPAARQALKTRGLSDTVHLVETDTLAGAKSCREAIGVIGASLVVPEKEIRQSLWARSLACGTRPVTDAIARAVGQRYENKKGPIFVCIDGYSGVNWKQTIVQLHRRLTRNGFHVTRIDFAACFKSSGDLKQFLSPYETTDNTFGRLFPGKLEDLLDAGEVSLLKKRLEAFRRSKEKNRRAVLCFGCGAASRPMIGFWDIIVYRDLTREEITRRSQKGLVPPLGQHQGDDSRTGQPAYLAGKRFHYVDFPLLDRHRRSIRKNIHFYVDDTMADLPKMIDRQTLDQILFDTASGPFQLKAFHDAGIWGGQWLKKVRNLPESMVNCAWAYELMAYQMSVKLPIGDAFIETPFAHLLDSAPKRIMGARITRRFGGIWPIRVNYDDCFEGDDMAIQIHPDAAYIKTRFSEPLHQDESYYIVDAAPDAYVYAGLKDGINLDRFFEAVRKAEAEKTPFDHRQFVNVFPAKTGDLFILPAGTVHASGKGCVVLELSCTTDRYTFHLYDYIRPDLNGRLRDIHLAHAIPMVLKYPGRTTSWVKKNLIQKPRLIRKGKDWTEHLIGKLDGYVPEIHRYEIGSAVTEDTNGEFHILSLVNGSRVVVIPENRPDRQFELPFTETVIVPACTGAYVIVNPEGEPAWVLKTMVNSGW
jgi:mannose-6-phosphate isomerase class I